MAQTKTNLRRASGPHPITLLPNEIRGIVFNKLKQSEVYNLRLVCKQWNEDIKDYYKFSINLNEDSSGLEFILQLRIAKLNVKKLVQKRMRILPFPTDVSKTEGRQLRSQKIQQQLTFKYPKSIQKITTSDSDMSANDTKELLQLCQKTLTSLELILDPKMSNHLFPSPFSYEFQNLKRLDIFFQFKDHLLQNNTILSSIQNSQFPSLKTIKITLENHDEIPNADSAVGFCLKLLSKNTKGVKRIRIELYMFEGEQSKEGLTELSKPEIASLKTITDLKQIKLFMNSKLVSTNSEHLLQLISRQRKLEKIDPGLEFAISDTLLKTIVLNNFQTIADITIQNLGVNSEAPFDMSVFENCHKLEYLGLGNMAYYSLAVTSGPELINFGSLPIGLVAVSFDSFRILSRDLLSLLNSDLLLTLEDIHLQHCGNSGDCGVNSTVLQKIEGLEIRKLTSVRLNGLNCSGSTKEAAKMVAVLKRFGAKVKDDGIYLIRDEDNPESGLVNREVLQDRLREEGQMGGCWCCDGGNHIEEDNFNSDSSSSE